MKKRIFALLLAAALLSGCGSSKQDTEKTEQLKTRITAVDTELASMYGKLSDMHEKGIIDDDFFNKFTALDARTDECMEYAEKSGAKADELEQMVKELETSLAECKAEFEDITGENDDALLQELISVQLAVKEQAGVMERALTAGRITQDEYDEFVGLLDEVNRYNAKADLKYDDEFRTKFGEIRSRLTALASKAGADNALIDRLTGTQPAERTGAEPAEETTAGDGTDIGKAEQGEIETETRAAAPKHELSDDVKKLIDDYMELQDYVSEKQNAGAITDAEYIDVLGVGVELAYLKEAVEKDGVTENNTYTLNDIKASLYKKSQALGYEKAEVFK
ncbi:MAG: hypothetical protein IKS17_07375 [Firmicutes bacterium]|nr:hypothetical protein [Bacillota bacterium]